MAPPILLLQDTRLTHGGAPLLDGVDLSVAPGERLCVVGRNGTGKSTLLKIAAGLVEADRGTRFVQPGATLRYLPQEPDLSAYPSTLAYVEAGLAPGDDAHRARYLLEELGLSGDEAPARLSGGEARRAALARILAPSPDILLLDEPTNHLDIKAIEWLEAELAASRSALVLISHDRRFLSNLTRACVWIDRGKARRLDRGFSAFEPWRDTVFAEEERERQLLDRKIVREEHWLRYGVTARRKRNERRVGELQGLREARRTARCAAGDVKVTLADSALSGKLVIEAVDITKSFGGPPIVSSFSTRIARGDRIGIVGPNGAGKTTLVNLLLGRLQPDAGRVRLGAGLEIATLEQSRSSLDPAWTLAEALTGGRGDNVIVGGEARHVVSYMQDFLFRPEQSRTPISVLSGGERARLMLARALARPANLLVLDEPTNDLDLETLDVLEETVGAFAGTVILVSHDRDFLDRTVDAVIVAEGDGSWTEYAGGYSDMLAQRGSAPEARRPARRAAGEERGRRDRGAEDPSASAAAAPRKQDGSGEAAFPAPKSRRLSFRDAHALQTLPATIAALETRIAALKRKLGDPGLFTRDRGAFDAASAELVAAEAELEAAEHRWLELELLKDELSS